MNIEIANRLVNLRKEKGFSQEQLAERIGVSRQAVSKWERSEASPDTDNLIMLARLYEVSLDELLRTEDEIPLPEEGPESADGAGKDGKEAAAPESEAPEETEGETFPARERPRDKIRIGADGVRFMDKNGNALTFGKGGLHLSGDDPEILEKDSVLQKKIRRGFTLAAVGGVFLCAVLTFFAVLCRSEALLLFSLAPVPLLLAFLGTERKAVRILFTLGVFGVCFLCFGSTGRRDIRYFGFLCLLLIPMYYRFIAFLRVHAERKEQRFPKPPRSGHPFCDFLIYHERIIDLAIYAAVWIFTVLQALAHSWQANLDLMFLCLIPVFQSFVRAVRERNPDRFSLESLLLFVLLFVGEHQGWRINELMLNFPILFTVPLYHFLCRRFMMRFAASDAEKSGSEVSPSDESA